MEQQDHGDTECSQGPERRTWITPTLKIVHHYEAELGNTCCANTPDLLTSYS